MILLLLFPNLSFMKLGSLQKYKSTYKGLVALEHDEDEDDDDAASK
jgi:hypothetical protein